MTPRHADAATRTATDLFRERLDNMLNQRHALYRLADRQQVAESVPGAVGTVMSQTGGGVTPELCPQGPQGAATGEPLRSCQTVSAAVARSEAVMHVLRPGGA